MHRLFAPPLQRVCVATETDVAAIACIAHETFAATYRNKQDQCLFTTNELASIRDKVLADYPDFINSRDHYVIVAQIHGNTVGYAHVHFTLDEGLPSALLSKLYILPDYQKLGLGKELLNACISEIIERNITRMHLEVWDQNTRAITLYKNMGFVENGGHWNDGALGTSFGINFVCDDLTRALQVCRP